MTTDTESRPKGSRKTSVVSPFRYPGSKGKAVRYIRPFWQQVDHDEYREPFFGGGAVYFSKPKARYNWLNDIDSELVTTLQVMADPERRLTLITQVTAETASRERHAEMKEWEPSSLEDIAYRFYYLNRTSYSGIMKTPAWGYHPTKSVPPDRWGDRIERAGRKLEGVKITALDFAEVITRTPQGKSVFLYLDPPYYASDQRRAYENSFTQKDHHRLCDLLQDTSYKFSLTYDDCSEVRELYQWATIHPVSWRYCTANARKATRKMGSELIITNF